MSTTDCGSCSSSTYEGGQERRFIDPECSYKIAQYSRCYFYYTIKRIKHLRGNIFLVFLLKVLFQSVPSL